MYDVNINDFPGGSPERIPDRTPKVKPPHFAADQVLNQRTGETENVRHTERKPDPEVLQLVQKLSQSPEIRLDRIEEVQQKLASGDFLTRSAAEATADAFLR